MNPLLVIPGVGKSIARDLIDIGVYTVSELRDEDPEALYRRICDKEGATVDRCMLYVMRSAVYYVSTRNPKEQLLKWWNWKDKTI